MDVTGIAIEGVVPHRGAMLFVEHLVAADADGATVTGTVRLGQLFTDDQGLPAWVGVEWMAQAIAAWAGCRARRRGEPVKLGFLLGTRRYQAHCSHFRIGAQLRVEAHCELFGDNGLGMFACRILDDGVVLASANLSVFEPDDSAAYLEGHAP